MCTHTHTYTYTHIHTCAGSGKSYTMMGSLVDEELKGIIPRLCDTLFDRIATVAISMMRNDDDVVSFFLFLYRNSKRRRSCRVRWRYLIWRYTVRKSKIFSAPRGE